MKCRPCKGNLDKIESWWPQQSYVSVKCQCLTKPVTYLIVEVLLRDLPWGGQTAM